MRELFKSFLSNKDKQFESDASVSDELRLYIHDIIFNLRIEFEQGLPTNSNTDYDRHYGKRASLMTCYAKAHDKHIFVSQLKNQILSCEPRAQALHIALNEADENENTFRIDMALAFCFEKTTYYLIGWLVSDMSFSMLNDGWRLMNAKP